LTFDLSMRLPDGAQRPCRPDVVSLEDTQA
jgi:hypothetical protein